MSQPEPTMVERVQSALEQLKSHASPKFRDELEPRYGIVAPRAFGTPMAEIKRVARSLGRDHDLALALWETGWYEARLLASLVDDPTRVTIEQMDRWRADFDNWAVVDTLCFNLFDRTPHALSRIDAWSNVSDEFGRRAGFVLLACVALHRKDIPDGALLDRLPLIEEASNDGRNFVKKGISWALRSIGGRNGAELRSAVVELATRLAASEDGSARWIGRDTLKWLERKRRA